MIDAYRTIEIPVQLADGSVLEVRVPFNVELLHRVEETVKRSSDRVWFVLRRSDQSILETFEEFCEPYFPTDFDWSGVQPTFAALFFSHVKAALLRSINDCMNSTERTETPTSPTEDETTADDPSPSMSESS